MNRRLYVPAFVAGAVTVIIASLAMSLPAGASVQLASIVSQAPVSWTPNVSAGAIVNPKTPYCNSTFFGSDPKFKCQSEVYSTAYVNGDVVVSGAFTHACQPGSLAQGLCKPGTQVTRNDIFAYTAGTGLIDPNFVPVLNAGPAWSVLAGAPGSNAVYVGGAFTTVNGASDRGLVELNVNPGVTTGATADGSIVTAFHASVSNTVRDLALSPDDTALYVGGQFTSVDSATKFTNGALVAGLARLNATSGALDGTFAFTLGDPIAVPNSPTLPIKIEAMTLSPDGTHLAFSGTALEVNGQSRPRLAIVDTGTTLGAPSSLSDWTAPILANNCSAEHDYVRSVDFSPDGTFLVIGDTGYLNDKTMTFSACDAVARLDVNSTNTTTTGTSVAVAPAWIDYAGGDSFYSVAIAGGVVYAGGHNRWVNNYCGTDALCGPNAELVNGLSALDANTGIGVAWWHPLTLRGQGTMYLSTFPANTYDGANAGLSLGTDVDNVAGGYHSEEALFPIAPTTSGSPGGPIPSGMFNEDGGTNVAVTPMCVDDAGNSATSGAPVELNTCTNGAEQNWSIAANGSIEINGLCLDAAGGATASGTPVVLDACSNGAAIQQWTQGPRDTLVNTGASTADATSVCLTDPNADTTAGTQLQIQDCSTVWTRQIWPLPAAQGPPSAPPVGEVFAQDTQKDTQVPCLDDAGDSLTSGNKVQMWTCTGTAEQQWTIGSGGTVQIGANHCLDSANGAQKGRILVVLNPCNGSASQQWKAGPKYSLINTGATSLNGTNYCLDDTNMDTANGTQVQLYSCTGAGNQMWRLPAV